MVLRNNIQALVAAVNTIGNMLDVDLQVAREWSDMLALSLTVNQPNGGHADLDDDNRMVLAAALHFHLLLVEEQQPYHILVPGLSVQPY